MRQLLTLGFLGVGSTIAFANDHNNFERGRPLSFDDAYSIAFGEREFESGFNSTSGRLDFSSSFGFGFAKNQDISVGFDPSRGSSTIGEFSYFRNVTREIGDAPAFGFRVTSNSAAGQRASEQLRLIATKAWHQYDKLHVNLNLDTLQSTGFILGYSTPLGYPKKFDQSFLAEVAYQQKQASVGVGLRRQISAQSVLDFGVKAGRQARFTLGYTIGF
jgi:hypothetical protein